MQAQLPPHKISDDILDRLKEDVMLDKRHLASHRRNLKRIGIGVLIALSAHLFFIHIVAPWLTFDNSHQSKTEVTQITSEELSQLKKEILKNNQLAPLLKQELHEKYKTKEAPKDATMMAPFNQTVPEQKVAGPRSEVPKEAGGKETSKQQKLQLSKLGLGSKLPKQPAEDSERGQGPPGPSQPVGRDSPHIRRGDQNLLNAVQNEFYSFFSRFEEPIIRNWYFLARENQVQLMRELTSSSRGRSGGTFHTSVKILLDRKGELVAVDVVESSGLPTADYIVTRAIRRIGIFPNPPPALFKGQKYFTHIMRFGIYGEDKPDVRMQWY